MVPLSETRRLLRRLGDVEELRTNPLAAPYFERAEHVAGSRVVFEQTIAARIRAAVISAIQALEGLSGDRRSHGARQRAIVYRCDVRGEKHETVARDLGISRREFYRERRRAFERLGLALEREFSTTVEVSRIRPTEFHLRLQYASSLHLVGRFDAALDELAVLSAESDDVPDRLRALCYGVEIACDAGEASRAGQLLESARELLRAVPCEPQYALCRASVALAGGILAWGTSNIDVASAAYDSAAAELRGTKDQYALELLAATLLRKADVYAESGHPSESLSVLGEARIVCDRMPHDVPLLRGDLAAGLGNAHAVTSGGLSLAIDELQTAFAIYQRHHAIRRAAKTSVELSILFMQRENYDESLRYGRTALRVARAVCGADEFAYMCLNLSYAEARSGHPDRALSLTREARKLVSEGGFVAALCALAVAEARLAAGQYGAAIRGAASARKAMADLGAERYIGAAFRIEAESHEKLGDLLCANEAIRAAIELLRQYGHPFSLVQAYRCSARVSGNSEHGEAAAQLMSMLQM